MYIGKGVVSTSDWIYGKDGNAYEAFFGKCYVLKAEDQIGCRTGSGQADFIVRIGTKDFLIISGCTFKGFQKCKSLPREAFRKILAVE